MVEPFHPPLFIGSTAKGEAVQILPVKNRGALHHPRKKYWLMFMAFLIIYKRSHMARTISTLPPSKPWQGNL